MSEPKIIERINDFVILVNSYPFYERELWDRNKGIVRVWGRDKDVRKINYVIYPKKYYTKEYIETNILPKYNTCPKCQIGENIINENKKISEIKKRMGKINSINKKYASAILGAAFLFVPIGVVLSIYQQYKEPKPIQ